MFLQKVYGCCSRELYSKLSLSISLECTCELAKLLIFDIDCLPVLCCLQNPNLQFEFLVSYLAELSLLDYKCVKFLPSMVASSVVFLARLMIRSKMNPWVRVLNLYMLILSLSMKAIT